MGGGGGVGGEVNFGKLENDLKMFSNMVLGWLTLVI